MPIDLADYRKRGRNHKWDGATGRWSCEDDMNALLDELETLRGKVQEFIGGEEAGPEVKQPQMDPPLTCDRCNGTGSVFDLPEEVNGRLKSRMMTCPGCGGRGVE